MIHKENGIRSAKLLFKLIIPYSIYEEIQKIKGKFKNRIVISNRDKKIKKYLEHNVTPKLQIASGKNILLDWLNTDIQPVGKMVYLDATNILPFENNSFNYIFSEHFIEHINLDQFRFFLKESHRILKKKGVIRLSTPDLAFVVSLFHSKKTEVLQYIQWYNKRFHPEEKKNSKVHTINGFFYNFEHKFLFDFDLLKSELEKAGFTSVVKKVNGHSSYKELKGIERHGQIVPEKFNLLESLIVEAVKK